MVDILSGAGHSQKTFGDVRAVDGISFTVRRGTITGLLGRNGAGKTTTIRMITGIFLSNSGEVLLGTQNRWTPPLAVLPRRVRSTRCCTGTATA